MEARDDYSVDRFIDRASKAGVSNAGGSLFLKSKLMDFMAFDRVTHSQVPPPAMLRERAAGGQNLAMDNPPLTGKGHIKKIKNRPKV